MESVQGKGVEMRRPIVDILQAAAWIWIVYLITNIVTVRMALEAGEPFFLYAVQIGGACVLFFIAWLYSGGIQGSIDRLPKNRS